MIHVLSDSKASPATKVNNAKQSIQPAAQNMK